MSWGGPPPGQHGYQNYPPQQPHGSSNQYYQQGPPPQGPPFQQPGGYPPPNMGAGYGPPQGNYPPQQPPPPHGSWGGPPPPAQHNQGFYNQGPPPAQAGGWGQPPPQGPPVAAAPSLGYNPRQVANVDTSRDADECRGAMKGFGTDEKRLIAVLTRIPDPVIMANLRQTYQQRHRHDLLRDVDKETSGYFGEGLEALIRGPLDQDVHNLHDAIRGAGTKESVLDDVLLARSNADIHAIKQRYQEVHKRSLDSDVRGDLSLKTERLFVMVLGASRNEESAPVVPHDLERDVGELYRATEGKVGTDQIAVCSIFTRLSDGQLRAVSHEFERRYRRKLEQVISSEFSGHMQDSLLRILHCAEDRAKADALALDAAMRGAGTKDRLLVNRLVRIHWNKPHLGQVKNAYKHFCKRELREAVRSETSGDYQQLMVALVDQS